MHLFLAIILAKRTNASRFWSISRIWHVPWSQIGCMWCGLSCSRAFGRGEGVCVNLNNFVDKFMIARCNVCCWLFIWMFFAFFFGIIHMKPVTVWSGFGRIYPIANAFFLW